MRDAAPLARSAASVEPRAIAARLVLGALRDQDVARTATASADRARHLAAVAQQLAVSLDESQTLNAVRRAALPGPASWCIVDVVEPDGSLHRLPAWHPQPAKRVLALDLEQRWSRDVAAALPELPYRLPVAPGRFRDALVIAAARGERSFRILQEIGFESLLVIPLIVRARVQGAITFVSAAGNPPLTADEIALADSIAAHCAIALDNANLYREASILRAAADAANRSKSVFLATMSHELRTPLNAIGGFADLMDMGLQGPVSADQHEALRRIKANQAHLTELIGEILEFARVDGGDAKHHDVAMSMQQAIEAIADRFADAAAAKQLSIATPANDRNAIACGDPKRVRQILLHLMMNAIEYTPVGGGPITLTSRAAGNSVRTCVTDHGPGIPPGRLESIFEPFVQLNDGLSDRPAGVGLGLAISRPVARTMKGDLTVESTPGLGSRFILSLPTPTSARCANDIGSLPSTRPGSSTSPPTARGGRKAVALPLRDIERIAIERTMEATGHNQSAAARMLGISRPTLLRKLKSYRDHR